MLHQITSGHRLGLSLLLAGLFASSIYAQEVRPPRAPSVVASGTADRVRFAGSSTAVQLRLQVYAPSGDLLFDASTKGNVLDWSVQDSGGERLSTGSYLCVVTVKSLSGRISQRIGALAVQEQRVELQAVEQTQLTAAQQREIGPVEENAAISVLKENEGAATTVIAHNGEEGQITRGRGALSFRIGDFYGGKDTEQMRLTPEGNLGIGITHPQARLDVDGLIRTSQGIVFADGTIQTTAGSASGGGAGAGGTGLGGGKLFKGTNQVASSGTDGNGKKKFKPELNVNEDLTVNGNIIFTPALARDITMSQNIGGIRIFAGSTLTTSPSSAAIQFFGNGHAGFPGQAFIDSGANNSAAVIFRTAQTGATIAERMRVTAAGNVGIGTISPAAKLHVEGGSGNDIGVYGNNSSSSGGVGVYGTSTSSSGAGVYGASASGVGVYGATASGEAGHFEGNVIVNGNVGIGTASPTAGLHVIVSNSGEGIRGESTGFGVVGRNTRTGIFGGGDNSGVYGSCETCIGVNGKSDSAYGVEGQSVSGTGVFGISASGVPIVAYNNYQSGTSNLVEGYNVRPVPVNEVRKFHITIDGTYVGGSDFAEALPARGGKAGYEPGDVLVLSSASAGAVEKASHPYDVRVAGVYSTRPGVLGADKDGASRVDPDELPVALIGVVPTKVSAENGPVRVGDLLTTSSTPGYAMKASPVLVGRVKIYRTGTILGKALEPLRQGKGIIKVLVTLR